MPNLLARIQPRATHDLPAGQSQLTFSLDAPATGDVAVGYQPIDPNYGATGLQLTAGPGIARIPAGSLAVTVPVPYVVDAIQHGERIFFVALMGVTGAVLNTVGMPNYMTFAVVNGQFAPVFTPVVLGIISNDVSPPATDLIVIPDQTLVKAAYADPFEPHGVAEVAFSLTSPAPDGGATFKCRMVPFGANPAVIGADFLDNSGDGTNSLFVGGVAAGDPFQAYVPSGSTANPGSLVIALGPSPTPGRQLQVSVIGTPVGCVAPAGPALITF